MCRRRGVAGPAARELDHHFADADARFRDLPDFRGQARGGWGCHGAAAPPAPLAGEVGAHFSRAGGRCARSSAVPPHPTPPRKRGESTPCSLPIAPRRALQKILGFLVRPPGPSSFSSPEKCEGSRAPTGAAEAPPTLTSAPPRSTTDPLLVPAVGPACCGVLTNPRRVSGSLPSASSWQESDAAGCGCSWSAVRPAPNRGRNCRAPGCRILYVSAPARLLRHKMPHHDSLEGARRIR